MKPPVIRQLESIQNIINRLEFGGEGNRVLADNGLYVTIDQNNTILMNVETLTATQEDETLTVIPANNTCYLINPSNYDKVMVRLRNASSTGCAVVIKNTSSSKEISILATIDGEVALNIGTLKSVKLVFDGTYWWSI